MVKPTYYYYHLYAGYLPLYISIKTMFLVYLLLQLVCSYNLQYMSCYFPYWMFCACTLVQYLCAVSNMAVFCSSLISCFPGLSFRFSEWFGDCSSCPYYYWYHFRFTWHLRYISSSSAYYYYCCEELAICKHSVQRRFFGYGFKNVRRCYLYKCWLTYKFRT